jgi:peptidoglycan/xylan/chitin deacetylase (PgdA/CDA1 family)
MMIRFDRFPEGKKRAIVLSFDDGRVEDRRLVTLLNKYGLKATFFLNSGKLGSDKYISTDELRALYAGHEIAVHAENHARLKNCPISVVTAEILRDRQTLENLTDSMIIGFAYPFGDYNSNIVNAALACGIEYARSTVNTHDFNVPENFMLWHPTNHILQSFEDTQRFLDRMNVLGRDSVLFLWGHSFEFNHNKGWYKVEKLFELISNNNNIWYSTCGAYLAYNNAVCNLKVSVDEMLIYNPNAMSAWLSHDSHSVRIDSGETIRL